MEMSLGIPGYEDFDPKEELPNLNPMGSIFLFNLTQSHAAAEF